MNAFYVGILFLVSGVTVLGQRGEVKGMPNRTRSEGFCIATISGSKHIEAKEIIVEGKSPDGRMLFGNLLILFDSESRCFWWQQFASTSRSEQGRLTQIESDLPSRILAYSTGTSLVVFRVLPLGGLYVRETMDHATSVEDAERKSIQAAENDPGSFTMSPFIGWTPISLSGLGSEFVLASNSVQYSPTKLLGVSKKDGKWELLLENQGQAKITLNEKYEIVASARLPVSP